MSPLSPPLSPSLPLSPPLSFSLFLSFSLSLSCLPYFVLHTQLHTTIQTKLKSHYQFYIYIYDFPCGGGEVGLSLAVSVGWFSVCNLSPLWASSEDMSSSSCSRVGDHTASAHDLGQVPTRHHCGWLIVDAALEASGAPVHELDGSLGLDGGHRCVHILWHHISSVRALHPQMCRKLRATAGQPPSLFRNTQNSTNL